MPAPVFYLVKSMRIFPLRVCASMRLGALLFIMLDWRLPFILTLPLVTDVLTTKSDSEPVTLKRTRPEVALARVLPLNTPLMVMLPLLTSALSPLDIISFAVILPDVVLNSNWFAVAVLTRILPELARSSRLPSTVALLRRTLPLVVLIEALSAIRL